MGCFSNANTKSEARNRKKQLLNYKIAWPSDLKYVGISNSTKVWLFNEEEADS